MYDQWTWMLYLRHMQDVTVTANVAAKYVF